VPDGGLIRQEPEMRVVCLCGSTRHKREFLAAEEAETLQGRIVLAPVFFSHADGPALSPADIERLRALHRRKIEMSDEIVVISPDGRIGESTADEIAYAESLGKPVRTWDHATHGPRIGISNEPTVEPAAAGAISDVYVIVRRDERVLLLHREHTGYKDSEWGPPSGKVERGETYAEAAARELAEETGVVAEPGDMRFLHAIERHSQGEDATWVGVFFELTCPEEPVNREPHKHSAIGWFPTNALPDPTVGYVDHVLDVSSRGEQFSCWRE
jgi:8-oxo-dGTP diphosphatase